MPVDISSWLAVSDVSATNHEPGWILKSSNPVINLSFQQLTTAGVAISPALMSGDPAESQNVEYFLQPFDPALSAWKIDFTQAISPLPGGTKITSWAQ